MNGVLLHVDYLTCLILLLVSSFTYCLYSGSSLLNTSSTIFVDCNDGIDNSKCGRVRNSPCKTLQFAIHREAQNINSSAITLSIASGTCNENELLELDCRKMTTKSWEFVGTNNISRPPTVIQISTMVINCMVRLLYIHWKKPNRYLIFHTFTSNITLENSTLEDCSMQFTGLNSNLYILHTKVDSCMSGDKNVPLFLLQTLYDNQAVLLIKDSTFFNNSSPIVHATKFHEVLVNNTTWLKNDISMTSNSSLITVSASSILLQGSKFDQTSGAAMEVISATNFMARNVVFSSNNGSKGSCLLIHQPSNLSLVECIFKHNTNPVIYAEDKDNVNIVVKRCYFGCNYHHNLRNVPFIQAPDGINITVTNCTKKESCYVHCKSGELLKSQLLCQKCGEGTFSFSDNDNITSNTCQRCPVGTYGSSTGRTNCTVCPEGTFARKVGSTQCKKCSNEFFTSQAGAETCFEPTLEFILVLVASVPLTIIPLFILIFRQMHGKSKRKSINNGTYRNLIQ